MLIGILSDIHDNLQNLEKALAEFSRRRITTLIFCGDFCSPIPARVLGAFSGEVHCVFGNGDPLTISRIAAERTNLKLHGPHAELQLGSARIAVTHYPSPIRLASARQGPIAGRGRRALSSGPPLPLLAC